MAVLGQFASSTWARNLVPPFFDRFSPFSTVFPTAAEWEFVRRIKLSTVFCWQRGR
jgi:hypothetical protein